MGYPLFIAFVLVLGVVTVFKAVRVVPQGFEWTVERFGKYTHTMSPGLHFLMPWMQRVGRKVNMMEQVLEVPSQDVITKDNAVVKVDGVIFFQVLDAARRPTTSPTWSRRRWPCSGGPATASPSRAAPTTWTSTTRSCRPSAAGCRTPAKAAGRSRPRSTRPCRHRC